MRAVPPFFPARVMTPAQVAAAVAGRAAEVQQRTKGKWHLCGDVSNEAFSVLSDASREETAMRISAFTTPIGVPYGVVSHQTRGFAHRFLLPLYEGCVIDLLSNLGKGGDLGFLLGREGNREALLIEPPHGRLDGFLPLTAMSGPVSPKKMGEAISELSKVIEAIADPAQVPSLRKGEAVVSVDVSAVMPLGTLQRFLTGSGERA